MAESVDAKIITGKPMSVRDIFTGRKYAIDIYQREYSWSELNVSELLDDLSGAFLNEFRQGDDREAVAGYAPYFMGPIVTSESGGRRFLVDGQQRVTTLTLLLIHLRHLGKPLAGAEDLAPLIYSMKYGKPSFNIDVPERDSVMGAILHDLPIDLDGLDESSRRIWARWGNLQDLFPEEIGDPAALLHFADWVLERVVLVEIGTTDKDMALGIFETMNDRGMRLSSTDLLKAFLIPKSGDEEEVRRANGVWREHIETLIQLDKNADADFLKAWLRGKYAESIRVGKKDAAPGDFDVIGTAFHKWVRENTDRMGLEKPKDYATLIDTDYARMAGRYRQLLSATWKYTAGLESVFYNGVTGVTLQMLPIMAAVTPLDDDEAFRTKASLVASFVDLMVARRMVNYWNSGYTTLRNYVFALAKELRDRDADDVRSLLADRAAGLEPTFDDIHNFGLTGRNRSHNAYLLARMTDWIEGDGGIGFAAYVDRARKHPFEVEHIWANHPDRHADEFPNHRDFADRRNRFGGLLLLPKDFNASYGDMDYSDKLPHYNAQNLLARSLHPLAYENNPTFLGLIEATGLPFRPYPDGFTGEDIVERQELYRQICLRVWDLDSIGLGGGTPPSQARDYYVAFGDSSERRWTDARRYGFISAGGGRKYTGPLDQLKPGDRVFTHVPKKGYVGVGTVTGTAVPAEQLPVVLDGTESTLRQLPIDASDMWHDSNDPDRRERAVPVRWESARTLGEAFWETGFFANQNIVCRLRHEPTRDGVLRSFGLAPD